LGSGENSVKLVATSGTVSRVRVNRVISAARALYFFPSIGLFIPFMQPCSMQSIMKVI